MDRPLKDMKALNAPQYDDLFVGAPLKKRWPEETLLSRILRRDDVDALKEYLILFPDQNNLRPPNAVVDEGDGCYDVFEWSATWGATNVLRFLLQYEQEHPELNMRLNVDTYSLLILACHHGWLETARFLLDTSSDVAADLRFRDGDSWTPILAATAALSDTHRWFKYHKDIDIIKYQKQCEDIIMLLLDRGANASDVLERQIARPWGFYDYVNRRPRLFASEFYGPDPELMGQRWPDDTPPVEVLTVVTGTVLSLAMKGASPIVIRRLIDAGADIDVKITATIEFPHDLSSLLDFAAHHLNVPALEILYEVYGRTKFREMLACRAEMGLNPFDKAVRGVYYMLPQSEIVPRSLATLSFLLPHCTKDVIRRPDKIGGALTFVMLAGYIGLLQPYAVSVELLREHRLSKAKLLIEHGADPDILSESEGMNALHVLTKKLSYGCRRNLRGDTASRPLPAPWRVCLLG